MTRPYRIYLLHPMEKFLPGADDWAVEVEAMLHQEESWDNWDLVVAPYDE